MRRYQTVLMLVAVALIASGSTDSCGGDDYSSGSYGGGGGGGLISPNYQVEIGTINGIAAHQPNQLYTGETYTIAWTTDAPSNLSLFIEGSPDGGMSWGALAPTQANDGSAQFTIPLNTSPSGEIIEDFQIRIELSTGGPESSGHDFTLVRLVPHPRTLPLMPGGQHASVVYSEADPSAKPTLDAAFGQSYSAGATSYELYTRWSDLEATPNAPDFSNLQSLLDTLSSANYLPYLVLATIDTNTLQLPSDLLSSSTPNAFASGVDFNSPALHSRFHAILDEIVPRLVAAGGYYLSIGNEVDIWLDANSQHADGFVDFVAAMRDYVRTINPRVAVGATLTDKAPQAQWVDDLLAAADVASFTYYLTDHSNGVRDPADVDTHIGEMLARVPASKYLLLQEAGCPSGYATPGNGSSLEIQRAFIENLFDAIDARSRIRFVNVQHLADWTAADIAEFQQYYGSSDPAFVEFLSTLGMHWNDGSAKPAFAEYLSGVSQLTQ